MLETAINENLNNLIYVLNSLFPLSSLNRIYCRKETIKSFYLSVENQMNLALMYILAYSKEICWNKISMEQLKLISYMMKFYII